MKATPLAISTACSRASAQGHSGCWSQVLAAQGVMSGSPLQAQQVERIRLYRGKARIPYGRDEYQNHHNRYLDM
jgi:hypothetical protein